jgi:hypothetical protein
MGLKLLGNELKIEGMHRILKVYDKNIVDLVERVSRRYRDSTTHSN